MLHRTRSRPLPPPEAAKVDAMSNDRAKLLLFDPRAVPSSPKRPFASVTPRCEAVRSGPPDPGHEWPSRRVPWPESPLPVSEGGESTQLIQ